MAVQALGSIRELALEWPYPVRRSYVGSTRLFRESKGITVKDGMTIPHSKSVLLQNQESHIDNSNFNGQSMSIFS